MKSSLLEEIGKRQSEGDVTVNKGVVTKRHFSRDYHAAIFDHSPQMDSWKKYKMLNTEVGFVGPSKNKFYLGQA